MEALKQNEYYALKLLDKENAYYGGEGYNLRYAKLYKQMNYVEQAKNGFSHPTEIVIVELNVRKMEE